MINKLFSFLFIAIFTLFSVIMPAFAKIQSESDINYKRNQLQTILNTDFMSFVHKNEMIGYRLDSYEIDVQFYKNVVYGIVEKLNNSIQQIEIIRKSQDLSDTDKEVQISNIYQDLDLTFYDLDTKTITFVSNCKRNMPSITFQRFSKKFEDFYNAFQFTSTRVYVK